MLYRALTNHITRVSDMREWLTAIAVVYLCGFMHHTDMHLLKLFKWEIQQTPEGAIERLKFGTTVIAEIHTLPDTIQFIYAKELEKVLQ